MTRVKDVDPELVARARAAAARIAPLAARIEAERRLPAEAVAALAEAGAFKLLVPAVYGGAETSPRTFVAVLEAIARADGSAGWCAMIGATSGLVAAYLPPEVAAPIYGPAHAVTCGVFAPLGRATEVAGGYRVSGRWPFASGCEHSSHRMGGVLVGERVRHLLFTAEETRVLDTWNVSGLRGTGSHDMEATDVFVPAERSFSLLDDRPRQAGALYEVPFFGLLAAGVAAVTLGIARAAIDAFVALATGKLVAGGKRSVAQRELAQLAVARAEARLGGARAFLHETVGEASGELGARARVRLAAAHAAREAAAAVDLVYEAGGGSSIYTTSPLQRCFRDVHVATQHVMVGSLVETTVGRVLFGLETDVSTL